MSSDTFAFASKYLNEKEREELLEVLRMTDLGVMLVMDALEEREIERAKGMLREKVSIEFASRHTGLDESTIRQLKEELDNE